VEKSVVFTKKYESKHSHKRMKYQTY